MGWLFLALVCGGSFWLQLEVSVSGSGLGWWFLPRVCGGCLWLGLHIACPPGAARLLPVYARSMHETARPKLPTRQHQTTGQPRWALAELSSGTSYNSAGRILGDTSGQRWASRWISCYKSANREVVYAIRIYSHRSQDVSTRNLPAELSGVPLDNSAISLHAIF